jgi:ParB-like chromosome segregation protein Spo0J
MTSILDIEVGDNVRHELGDLKGLKASIDRNGILQPLIVQEGDNGKVLLIAGHRRLEAAIQLGLGKVPTYEINEYEVGDVERLEIQMAENLFREDLTVLERAQAMLALSDSGQNQRQVAAAAGVTQKSAKGWLALGKADVIDSGDITEDALVELALEVPTEDIAASIEEFLSPTYRDYAYRDLESAYATVVSQRKLEAAMAKVNAAIAKLEEKGIEVVIGKRGQYGSDAVRGYAIIDIGHKNADRIAGQDFGHQIVLDIKAHRDEECHVYYLSPGAYDDLPKLGEYCTKPKRHEKATADVQVPNAKKIKKAQAKVKAQRKVGREEIAAKREEVADWLRDGKLTKGNAEEITYTAALKTLPHGWQDDIAKLLELELDDDGDKQIEIPDSEFHRYRMESAAQRAIDVLFEGKSGTWTRSFMARVLVAMDVIGNRSYTYDSTLTEWYNAQKD